VAKKLPCLIDMDQPTVANFAWAGHVRPIGDLIDAKVKSQLISGGKGEYKGVLYSAGQIDAALGLFARKSALAKAGVRVPTLDKPWTLVEFNEVLAKLKALPEFEYVIDMHNTFDGEWWTYAFSPWMQSFGGDLIDRKTMVRADGVLNGKEAVAFGKWFQSLYTKGYANKKPADDKSFVLGRVPLDYMGNWAYGDAKAKWGDDMIVLPPPDFGKGSKIGAASWQYGISSSCAHPEGAAAFINHMLEPKQIGAMSAATKLIPTTQAGADLSPGYKSGGPLQFYFQFSNKLAVVRPSTPGYPFLTSTYEKAMRDIVGGADVQRTLDNAADAIDRNIKDNKGYGFKL
jgi:multiple sugar transport system substrate-binding protein